MTDDLSDRITIRLTTEQKIIIKKMMDSGKYKTKSEAIRRILNIGIEQIKKDWC